jgi:hypothetical protein
VNPSILKTWFPLIIVACLCFASSPGFSSEQLETSAFPSLVSGIRIRGPLDFCGETVPLDEPEIRERLEKEMLLSLWDRAQVILWIKRSGRYFPVIEKLLKAKGLPGDLKYIAVVESALRPHAGSVKGAVGFWQFIKPTGRKYGLRINRWIDERRSIFTSTEAALKYFKKLHEIAGSWTLAAAAYNMGERGLVSAVKAQSVKNYYRLYLPRETQRYVFKALAAKLILSDPGKFGFKLRKEDLYQPLEFDRLNIEVDREARIQTVALAAGTDYKKIKDLNPQLRGSYLPRGRHRLLVPKDAGSGFEKKFNLLLKRERKDGNERIYVVRKGDNLSIIAKRFRVSLSSLLAWNRLKINQTIHPGDRLIIYRN